MKRFDHDDFSQISSFFDTHTVKSVHNVYNEILFLYKTLIYNDKHPDVADLFDIRPNAYGIKNMRKIR